MAGMEAGGEPGRESCAPDSETHQPHRVDTRSDHLLWSGRPRGDFSHLPGLVFSHRSRMRRWCFQRAASHAKRGP